MYTCVQECERTCVRACVCVLAFVHACKSAYVSPFVCVFDVRSYFLVCVFVRESVCVCLPTCVRDSLRVRARVFMSA